MAGSRDAEANRSANVVAFSTEVFSLDVIKRAAYRIADIAVVDIDAKPGEIVCTLNFHHPQTDEDAQRLINDFKLEVLDQDLRAAIAKETEPMRNAILGYAFSKTGLQGK
ncbi:MAG TPA: His-Xaa-Ser system protein HxsD [Blastocatellia bacterium]|nr:His-Xaa-Ser system protein HxsD [Blastocatellia bacterium]